MERVDIYAPNAHQLMIKVNAEIAIWHRKGSGLEDIHILLLGDLYCATLVFQNAKEVA